MSNIRWHVINLQTTVCPVNGDIRKCYINGSDLGGGRKGDTVPFLPACLFTAAQN